MNLAQKCLLIYVLYGGWYDEIGKKIVITRQINININNKCFLFIGFENVV